MLLGVPTGTAIALFVMVALPIATLVLYSIDRTTNDGYVSVLGRR